MFIDKNNLFFNDKHNSKKTIFKGKVEEIWIFTNDFEKSSDAGHRVSIHLAHVPTAVSLARFSYVKRPRTMATMCHSDPMILCNNVSRYRENRLRIDS